MKADDPVQTSRDLLNRRSTAFVLFWLPAIVVIASGFFEMHALTRAIIWTVALVTIGLACLANARACGRVHCYFTGPFFLGVAIVTMLYGLGSVPLGKSGWNIIAVATVAGAIALCFIPEIYLGRYRQRHRASDPVR